jgi:phosphoglycolate phosphatase
VTWKNAGVRDGRRTLLLWDIDHTLIENAGVSKENYALAFEILTGRAPARTARTDGRTDVVIMSDLLSLNGVDPGVVSTGRQLAALVEAGRRNRDRLAERGHALPGAAACLERLAADPGVIQSVLTGNVEPNARMKLEAFGLDRWIDFAAGAYGSAHAIRAELVPVAQARAAVRGFDSVQDVTVLVGDTVLDVEAGLGGGARVIAVATGVSSPAELLEAGADAVLASLADVERFVETLHRVAALGLVGPRG